MGFKNFLLESGRDVSKKFKIYQDDSMEKYQEVDIETVRNIIVNKLAKELNEKPNLAQKTREEIEDGLRLREIKQSMGDLFMFKYSIFNRPLIPASIHVDLADLKNYEAEKTDFNAPDEDSVDLNTDDTASEDQFDAPQPNGADIPSHDFGLER